MPVANAATLQLLLWRIALQAQILEHLLANANHVLMHGMTDTSMA